MTRHNQSDPGDQVLAEEAMAWIVRMTSGRSTDHDLRALQAWLDRGPAHRRAYDEAEALWRELGDIPDPRRAPRAHRTPLQIAWRTVDGTARRRVTPAMTAAACMALAAICGLWAIGGPDLLRADYATTTGETRELVLDDGSIVHLNTGTAVAVDLSDACRCVELLRGEAFFEVAPQPLRPFQVRAGDGTLEALGTAFVVRDAGENVAVAVIEGLVRVLRDDAMAADVTIGAGETARYGLATGLEIGRADVRRLTAWRHGRLIFADRPLRAVVAEVDRYRPGTIWFLDAAIAEQRFTGVLEVGDTDRALAAIEATLPVEVVGLAPWITLIRARE